MDTKNLNEWQKAAARAYCGGEDAHIADGEPWEGGDCLFEYLMADLADADSAEVAAQRIEQAILDLDGVVSALADAQLPESIATDGSIAVASTKEGA